MPSDVLSRQVFLGTALGAVAAAGPSPRHEPLGSGAAIGVRTVYAGTYSTRGSEGIYLLRLDPRSGELRLVGAAAPAESPSFLALGPGGRTLYAVNELSEYAGEEAGAVSAFAVDRLTGGLSPLGTRSTRGTAPCHLCAHPSGRWLLVANYGAGSVALLPVDEEGRLGEAAEVARHRGCGPDAERQDGPHAHWVGVDPADGRVLAADLGIDRVLAYRLDVERGTLTRDGEEEIRVKPGSGPRHLAFPAGGGSLYLVNELASTVCVLRRDPSGRHHVEQTLSTLPEGHEGENLPAGIQLSPDGRFLYVSNRGHDSIAVFAVDAAGGALAPVQHAPTRGRAPRHFALDPSGRWLLAANQESDTVVVFAVDQATGELEATGAEVGIPAPVCLLFA